MEPASLRGVRVIIVEDSFTIARSLQFLLTGYECEVTGIAGTVDAAFALVARTPFDAAILDIDLNGTSVVPVAEHLRRHGRRFVFLTGYGDSAMLPEDLRAYRRLDKPVDPEQLVGALLDTVGQ